MAIRPAEFEQCFELEALEPRVMLSADGLGAGAPVAESQPSAAVVVEADELSPVKAADDMSDTFGTPAETPSAEAAAVTFTWNNAAGGDWNTAANWSGGVVPTAGANVVIDGLNSGATVTLTGDTPVLGDLAVNSGTLTINGNLHTNTFNVAAGATLNLNGAGLNNIDGNVNIAAGATLNISGTTIVNWRGNTWSQHGDSTLANGTEFLGNTAGTLTVHGGLFQIDHGAAVRVTDSWGNFFVDGGELRVNGTFAGEGGNAEFIVYSGTLSGSGTLSNSRGIFLHGTVAPGDGAGTVGTLTFNSTTYFRPHNGADWALQLEIQNAEGADRVVFAGNVEFDASGTITIDASGAVFHNDPFTEGSHTVGDALDLISASGTISGGSPTLNVLTGEVFTVNASQGGDGSFTITSAQIAAELHAFGATDWATATNWTNGLLPQAGGTVYLRIDGGSVTLTGDTPALGHLYIDGGILDVTGGLNATHITGTNGGGFTVRSGTSAITGDVSLDGSFNVLAGATLTWSGGTWAQHVTANVGGTGSTFIQTAGVFTGPDDAQISVQGGGTLQLNGGQFIVPTGGSLNFYHASFLTIAGGNLHLAGGLVAAFNETVVSFTSGVISGAGNFRVNHLMTIAGIIRPGGQGTTGTLTFTQGEDNVDATITFSDTWSIELDVLSAADFDQLSFDATVNFGASGAILVKADTADFTGTATGTALTGVLTVDGTLTGTPTTVTITPGQTHTVTAAWSGNALSVATAEVVTSTVADDVNAALAAATAAQQSMLGSFNLGSINFTAQGRPAVTLPSLPDALADLFNLTALSGSLNLPTIGAATNSAEAQAALQAAGYTITTPGGGADFVATLTRTIASDRPVDGGFGGANFNVPDGLLAGLADQISLTAVLNLTATLLQHVVFEFRDGALNLLADSYLALALAGGASLSGSVRQGGRTVTTTGSSTADLDVYLHDTGSGITATADGTLSLSLSLAADPVTLAYSRDFTLTRTTDTLVTSTTASSTLSGTLTLAGVNDSAGDPAVLALSGTLAGDGQSWSLSGSGSNLSWLNFSVTSWSFTIALNQGSFSGSGSFGTALDFLASGGSTPNVNLSASFDQDSLTFTGSLDNASVAVTNPAGGTYLSISNFASTISVTGNLDTGVWTGALSFTGGDSSFTAPGTAFTATITDGDDADAFAVSGSYDFSTQSFTTTVDQFEMVAANILRFTAAGVTLSHQRNATEDQELVQIDDLVMEMLFLTVAPSTGPPSATASSVSIRTNGIVVGSGSVTLPSISIGSVLTATDASLSFTSFSFLDGTTTSAGVTLSAASATLFPGGTVFTATATNLSGTYDFSAATDRLALTAGSLSFGITGLVEFSASNVSLRPEGDVVFSAATMAATLPHFGVSGEISGLEIAADGTPSAVGLTISTAGLTERLKLGGLLPLGITGLAVDFRGDTNDNGVRDPGETFRLDAFDLTVTGTFDFSLLNNLPFTPVVKIGDSEFSNNTQAFSFTMRFVEGTFTPWQTETITLGVSDLDIGNLLRISGSVTLGGYTDGEWTGGFDGEFDVTVLSTPNIPAPDIPGDAPTDVTVDLGGGLDVEAGTLNLTTSVKMTVGLGAKATLVGAGLDLSLTIQASTEGAFSIALQDLSIAGTIDRLVVNDLLEAENVSGTFTGFSISSSGIGMGSLGLSVGTATVLPGNTKDITATATGITATYDFTTDPDTFTLTVATMNFALGDKVSFAATNVSLTPLGATLFSVGTISASLPSLSITGTITGFELAADGSASVAGLALDTTGLAESLDLAGVLPFDVTGLTVTPPEGETRIDLANFDLTVTGTIDFSKLTGLPFTPTIQIGSDSSAAADTTAQVFSFTVRMSDGTLQIWNTPTITLGISGLAVGDLATIGGSVTLGGYTDGVWVGSFGGSLTVTSANPSVTGSATAVLTGSVDESTGQIALNTVATLDLGIADNITLSSTTLTLDMLIAPQTGGGVVLTVNTASATVGTFTVTNIFTATNVSVTLTGLTVSSSGISIGSLGISVGSATILPGNALDITATATGISGSYDFTTDPDTFTLTVASVNFALGTTVNFSASNITLSPNAPVLFSVASATVSMPDLEVTGTITGFELSSAGVASAVSMSVDTSGLAASLNLGGVLPFNLQSLSILFLGDTNGNGVRDEGEVFRLDAFELGVVGVINFGAFGALPFTPTVRIGDKTADDETDTIAFSVRYVDGVLTPWNIGPIELGIAGLKIGGTLQLDANVTLGGYANGVWVGAFDGSVTVTSLKAPTTETGDAPSSVTVDLGGDIDPGTGSLSLSLSTTLSFGLGDNISFVDAGLALSFTLLRTEGDGTALELRDMAATATAGEMNIGTLFAATNVSVGFTGFTVSATEVSLDSISVSADSATLLPGNTAFTATTTGFTGGYDFTAESNRLTLTAAAVNFAVGETLTFAATNVALTPEADIVLSIATIAVNLPSLSVGGTLTGFELHADGTPSAIGLTLDTSGLADALQIGEILPFNVTSVGAKFLGDTNNNGVRDEGEVFRLDAFDLSVSGTFDFAVLGVLPFTPTIQIGETVGDDSSDSFSFTVRVIEGEITPWDIGPVTLGVSDLNVGESLTFGGSITLGGYQDGVWVADVGGSLTIAGTSAAKNLSGSLTVAINGSWNSETGVLAIAASFTVSMTLGDYVDVTNASISLGFDITSRSATDTFELGVANFGVNSAAVESLSVSLGDVLALAATEATIDFTAEGSETLLSVGSLSASLTGLGISGTAQNFSLAADGTPSAGENFGVSFSFSPETATKIKWPDWLPIEVSVFELHWKDFGADPLDFTLRLSASISAESVSGSTLTLEGSIDNLVIDVGALKSGAFPIIGLGQVSIAVGGKISTAEVSAGLILGLVRLDAEGNQIADDDDTTPVVDGLLWGAVRGSINVAGYGGLEVFLGLSEYGPLQGYIKATVPIVIPKIGIAFTDFRAGITFNSTLPAVTDPKELGTDPGFKPATELTFAEWTEVLENSLANQIAAHAEAGNFGVLLSPFTIEGGVTIYSIYASTGTFNIQADFKMDSVGRFFARGNFQLGGTLNFTASLYIDMGSFVTEGSGAVLFLASLPSDLPVATIYGALTFDFGVEVDPDNPPAAPFEQFMIRLEGGADLSIAGLPGFEIAGAVAFEVALNAPSLRITVDGRATLPHIGDAVGLAGEFRIFFGANDTVQAAGILALTPADFSQFEAIGVTLDGLALLRFNTTSESIDYTLTIPGQSEPRTFTVAAGEGSLLIEGLVSLAPGGVELFRLGGILSATWTPNGLDVLVAATLTAGPVATPLLRFEARGYLRLEMNGITPGMAAQLTLTLDTNDDVLATIGVELEGSYEFIMNTTGADVDFTLPTELAATAAVERIHLPRGPPSADGNSVGEAGAYLIVRASGVLNLLDVVDMEGVFDFTVANGQVELDYEAKVKLAVGEVVFYQYDAEGTFRIDSAGIYGQADLTIDASVGLPTAGLGFAFDVVYQLQVNTTNAEQTLGEVTLTAGNYARVRASGALVVGAWRFTGTYDLTAAVDGISAAATGSVSLGVGEVEFMAWSFDGTLLIRDDGIFASLSLSQSRSAPTVYGFGFGAGTTYQLALNTTGEEIDGVAAGLGARIIVTGALELGNWSIEGTYTLNATTTGIGFAASAALIFQAGDDELFRVPLEFEIELAIPGIVEEINLELSLADLGINVPGLELSGSAQILINSTGTAQGDIPAGPMLRFVINGQAVVGGLALDGTFGFESTLGGVTMFGDFTANLGPAENPLLSFTGEGQFELTLLGVAGYMDLALTGGVSEYLDFFGADFSFFIAANTRAVPYTLGDRELAAGPLVKIGATGTLNVAGLALAGSYTLAAGGGGVDLTMDATASVNLGSTTLISFTATGGMHLGLDGLVAALDVTPDTVDFASFGLALNTDVNFALRINTTGSEQTVNDITLEAGNYARVTFTSSLTYGVSRFEGEFSLSVVDNTAELLLDTQFIVELPALGDGGPTELFRMGARGGLRIAPEGVVAAIELDRGALDQLSLLDVRLPIGLEQTFALHFNTTGAEQTLGDVTLVAGNYLKIVTTGEMRIGLARLTGLYSFSVGATGLEIVFDADVFIGIPDTEISLFRWHAQGGFQIKANGVAGAIELGVPVGLGGLESIGLKLNTIGLEGTRIFRINTTGEEVTFGEVTLEAGHYIEIVMTDRLSIGLVEVVGTSRFYLGENGLEVQMDGILNFGLPADITGGDPLILYSGGMRNTWAITSEGIIGRTVLGESTESITVAGLKLTPDYSNEIVFSVNTTSTDREVQGETIRANSTNLSYVLSVSALGQTVAGEVIFTIDFDRQVILGLLRGRYDFTVGDWTPFSFAATGIVLIAADGAALDLSLDLDAGAGIPGATLNGDWNFRLSTFTTATTITGFTANGVIVPTLVFEEGSIYRVSMSGTLEIAGLLLDGSYTFQIADGSGLFDTSLTVSFDATVRLAVGGTTLLSFDAVGGLSASVNGIWGGLDINLATGGLDSAALGFSLDASYRLEVNTTGAAQTVGELNLPAGPYARVQASGDLVIGALKMNGTYAFGVGVNGITVDAEGTVAFAVLGITFYEFGFTGQFALDATGLFAQLSVDVASNNRAEYGFGFSADATYTLGINTTGTERDGIAPGLGARVRVEGAMEVGDISLVGVYDLTASTTGIGFAASAALVLKTEDTVLLEIPLEFSYTLEIPGIVDRIALETSAEDLGINIPGLALAGSAEIVINTTGTAQGDIPAGPILQLAVNGSATVGDLELTGRFGFESSLNRTRMITDFTYTLGDENDPLLQFAATGAFNLGLDGIAGIFDLSISGGDESITDLLGADLTYKLVVNTTSSEYELFDRTLPAGPLYQVEAHGDLHVLNFTLSGDYLLRIDGEGLLLDTNAELDLSLPGIGGGDPIKLFGFDVDGGIAINKQGVATALELTPTFASLSAFGLDLGPEASYELAINTTGQAYTFGDVELEAGVYARVKSTGSMSYGIATLTGSFTFEADTAGVFEMSTQSEMELNIPGLGELLRFSMSGGFRFDSTGVIAAIDLERSAASERIEIGGVTLPFKAEQSFLLRMNTTGEAREIAGVELVAGNYFAIDTVGEVDFGIARSGGPMSLVIEDHALDIKLDQEIWVGIPGTDIALYEADVVGELHLSSDGIYAALDMQRHVGSDAASQLGLSFGNVGAAETQQLFINSTGVEQTAAGHTLRADTYIEIIRTGGISIGFASFGGQQRLYAGADGFVLENNGSVSLGLPAVGDLGSVTLFEAQSIAEFRVTGEGAWGYFQLSRAANSLSVAGVSLTPDFDAGVYMSLNTTGSAKTLADVTLAANSVRIAGAMAFDFLGAQLAGQVVLTVDWEQGYGAYQFDGSASIGIGDWRPFTYDADGFILIGRAGAVTNLNLALTGGVGVPGVDFNGTWKLRASTMSEGVTIAGFSASGLDVPEITIEAGNMLRTNLVGSITVSGGLTLNGEFDLAANNVEFSIVANGSVDFFGVTANFSGFMYIHPERGMVANVEMSWGGIDNAFMEISGQAFLRINTWHDTWEGVSANTYEVGINNAVLRLGFTELRGWAAFQWVDGEARMWTSMNTTVMPGVTGNFSGFVSSAGVYDLNGNFDVALGVEGVAGAFGTATLNFNNETGVTGNVSGRIDVPGGDHGTLNATIAITADEARLQVQETAFVLLGGIVRIDAAFEVVVADALFSVYITQATAALRVPGFEQSFSVSGWLNSQGQFDLNGSMALDVGNTTLGINGTVAVNVSHSGVSGALSGRIFVPGDFADYSGTFAADNSGFLITGQTRFVLLGGLVLLDGAFEYELKNNSTTMRVQNMSAESRVPGFASNFTLNGWINSAGEFNLDGTASLDFGNTTLGINGDIAINVSHNGISGTLSGRVYVPGDYGTYSGSFVADSAGFRIEAQSKFVLLSGLVLLEGGFGFEANATGSTLWVRDMTSTSRVPGLGMSFTVNGWIGSGGHFNLDGRATLNVGTATLGFNGQIDVNISHNGIRGNAWGRVFVPGDYGDYTGSLVADSSGFKLTGETRFALLGGLVVIGGGFEFESRNGSATLWVRNMTAETRVPGWATSFTVNGWIGSGGHFNLDGTASVAIGVEGVAGAFGDVAVNISHDNGITGRVTGGRLYVPGGDYATLTGSMVANSRELTMNIDHTAFVILGGAVRVEGGFGVTWTDGYFTVWVKDAVARTNVPGFNLSLTVNGWLNSNGNIDLRGTTSWDLGNSTLGLSGTLNLWINKTEIGGSFSGRLNVPGDFANVSGRISAGTWGLNFFAQARFALLGGVVILDGDVRLELRSGSMELRLTNINVRIAGAFEGRFSGIIRSDGFFDLDGTASVQVGHWSTAEVSGNMRVNIRSDHGVRAWFDGRVYVRHQTIANLSDFYFTINSRGFSMSLSVNFGISDVRVYTTLSVHVYHDGVYANFRGSAHLWGFRGSVSGWFDSRNGQWRVSGDVGFSVGGTVGASGRIEFDVGHDRLRFHAVGKAWAGFRVYWWHPTPKWYNPFKGHWDSKWVGGTVHFRIGLDVNRGTASVSVAGRNVNLRFKGGFRVWLSNVGGSTVFLDVNRNGTLDEGEPFTIADDDGNFSFDEEAGENESDGEATVITLSEVLGALFAHDTNANGIIDAEEGTLYVVGGTRLDNGEENNAGPIALEGGLASSGTDFAGATVFLDLNGNGVQDEGEASVTTDELGIYAFGQADAGSPWLGALAQFDTNGNGQLDEGEIQLYAVNGLQPPGEDAVVRLFRDTNGDGNWQEGEVFAFVTLAQMSVLGQAAANGTAPAIANTPLAVFDTDGDGVLEQGEGTGLVATEPVEVRVPLTAITAAAAGTLPVADAEYVFADANGNGVWDADELRVTVNELGFYTFITADNTDEASRLGRLAPFDTNGNGQIDPEEGVFVVQGGTDNDNGISNNIAATGLASGYGGGIEQTINPLTSLQVSLVDQGLSEDEADDAIASAFGLPGDIDVNTFNAVSETSGGDGSSENAALGAGATITTLVMGGASLLGDGNSAATQDAVLDSLAEFIIENQENGEGSSLIDLSNADTIADVLSDAASDTGVTLDAAVTAAAATVLGNINEDIQEDAAAGGAVDRNLAATKAVVLTNVTDTLDDLADGNITADAATNNFTDEAIDDLASQVVLNPDDTPFFTEMSDVIAKGGDRLRVTLTVDDEDTALRNLSFTVTSSDGTVVSAEDVEFVLEDGAWHMLIDTGLLTSGATELTVTASDGSTSTSTSFNLTLDGLNPVVRLVQDIANQTLRSGESVTLDLADYFEDPNNDANFTLLPVGENNTVDAVIANGQLTLTARGDLSGLAVFDLVATDDLGSASTRFSVVTYPTLTVSPTVRYTATGTVEIDVMLSNPSTQPLTLGYDLSAVNTGHDGRLAGVLNFAAGQTTATLVIDLADTGFGDVNVNQLALDLNSTWAAGDYDVAIRNLNPQEVYDLQRRLELTFTLTYDFLAELEDDDEDAVLALVSASEAASAAELHVAMADAINLVAAGQGDTGLSSATSLETLERPRALQGL